MARVKLKLRPWRAGDLLAFDPRSDFEREMRLNAWDWTKGPPGPTWTLVECDRVLGVGGGIAGEDGAWLAWACLSDLPARSWPEAVRCAGLAIDHLLKREDVRWLWAQCRADFSQNRSRRDCRSSGRF